MKPRTKLLIEAKYGFTITKLDRRNPNEKFTLHAKYPDGQTLQVHVWKRVDIHVAIQAQLRQEELGRMFLAWSVQKDWEENIWNVWIESQTVEKQVSL